MQGIEFNVEEDQGVRNLSKKIEPSGNRPTFLLGLLASIGVTDRTIANSILAGVAALFLGIAIFIFAGTLSNNEIKLSPQEAAARLNVLTAMQNSI